MSKISLYYHTLRYLKPIQLRYRLYYALRDRWRKAKGFRYDLEPEAPSVAELALQPSLPSTESWLGPRKFSFLNLEHQFEGGIDWDFEGHGKLWTYNLCYFDFLQQKRMNPETGLQLIRDLMKKLAGSKNALEPYPISLRLINWIKFLRLHGIREENIDRSLYAQYRILLDKLEYHLLGNHLLENAFALLFGVYYFRDWKTFPLVSSLLEKELEEQILEDGGHFERSPMYHQILLFRLLDCYNLAGNNDGPDEKLAPFLRYKAEAMLGWMRRMTFSNDSFPLFNDSSSGIAPPTTLLSEYGRRLGLEGLDSALGESGYRRFSGDHYTLIVDVGDVGPDYIPGHAHCDTLSFVMESGAKPWIVDTGVSTYEKNERRQLERSTASHNVVQIGTLEQSEVWGGFRVARRARATLHQDTPSVLEASHDGFARQGYRHRRLVKPENDRVLIEDIVEGRPTEKVRAYFHFAPGTELHIENNKVRTNRGDLVFQSLLKLEKASYFFAPKFNRTVKAPLLVITFQESLRTKIEPKP